MGSFFKTRVLVFRARAHRNMSIVNSTQFLTLNYLLWYLQPTHCLFFFLVILRPFLSKMNPAVSSLDLVADWQGNVEPTLNISPAGTSSSPYILAISIPEVSNTHSHFDITLTLRLQCHSFAHGSSE